MSQLTFGQKVLILRKNKGLSQRDLSEKLNIAFSSVAKYENGKVFPSTDILIKLSDFFNVSIDYLLKDIDNVTFNDKELLQEMTEVDKLDDANRTTLKNIIRSFLGNQQLAA